MARLIPIMDALVFLTVLGSNFLPFVQAASYTEEITANIVDLRWKDALQEPYFDIVEMDVVDSTDKKTTVLINQNTIIRDSLWHIAHAVYLQKGMKVKVLYVPRKDQPFVAQKVYILEEKQR